MTEFEKAMFERMDTMLAEVQSLRAENQELKRANGILASALKDIKTDVKEVKLWLSHDMVNTSLFTVCKKAVEEGTFTVKNMENFVGSIGSSFDGVVDLFEELKEHVTTEARNTRGGLRTAGGGVYS